MKFFLEYLFNIFKKFYVVELLNVLYINIYIYILTKRVLPLNLYIHIYIYIYIFIYITLHSIYI